jgi:hypothetical protein
MNYIRSYTVGEMISDPGHENVQKGRPEVGPVLFSDFDILSYCFCAAGRNVSIEGRGETPASAGESIEWRVLNHGTIV